MKKAVLGMVLCLVIFVSILPANGLTEEQQHTVIYQNGMHYIELPKSDPAFPSFAKSDVYQFVIYCMNHSLLWPHPTEEHREVPPFVDGYLNTDTYQTVLDQLTLLLYAGYPNNGKQLYEITKTTTSITPEQFEFFLIPSAELKAAFPALNTSITYSRYESGDATQKKIISDFVNAVMRAQFASQTTLNGMAVQSIINSMFYKAAFCLFSAETWESTPLEVFVKAEYAADYLVTEEQAYNATQNVVWYLLKENDVEGNEGALALNSELSQKLYNFAVTAKLSDYLNKEPMQSDISNAREFVYGYDSASGNVLTAPLVFSYDPTTGKYISNENQLVVPVNFPQVFEVDLPAGISVFGTSDNRIVANTPYHLVADSLPTEGAVMTCRATAKWIKALRQYSPYQSEVFQHMVGEIVDQNPLSFSVPLGNNQTGSLTVSKTASGNVPNELDAFVFTVSASLPDGEPLMGEYGDMFFDLSADGKYGEASFTLHDKESKTATALPIGTTYRVSESNEQGAIVTVNGTKTNTASGVIQSDRLSYIVFNNHWSDASEPEEPIDDMQPANVPKTGDSAHLELWFVLLAISSGALLIMLIQEAKKHP